MTNFLLSSKDFKILDLHPPNNPTSHYGACHFGYNLALRQNYINFPLNINLYNFEKKNKHLFHISNQTLLLLKEGLTILFEFALSFGQIRQLWLPISLQNA